MNSSDRDALLQLRHDVDRSIVENDFARAHCTLGTLWRSNPTQATAGFVNARFQSIRKHVPVTDLRVAVLRSFTVEPIVTMLQAGAAVAGLNLSSHVGGFNAFAQEILDPESPLYRQRFDVVILAAQTRDIAPELWDQFAALGHGEVITVVERVTAAFRQWIELFRGRTESHLIVHGLEVPPWPCDGIYDSQSASGQAEAIRAINLRLRDIASRQGGVYLLDYDALVAQHGRLRWYDERRWQTVRLPMAADCIGVVAEAWLRFLHPIAGKTCKALVCDLDNTLWGGVIGEDGIEGIQIGWEYPGAAFRQFQQAILDLCHRGIILAVCSKNNFQDAMEALEKHPEMLLRPRHFAAFRINWQDKVRNLRELATELNIGVDALALADDNPVERELVRNQLPAVTVIELPSDPLEYVATLRRCPVFERLALTTEDRQRHQLYAAERQRVELRSSAGSLDEFYHSLQLAVEFGHVDSRTAERVAQLTQKTNQLNMTTRRYSQQQILQMAHGKTQRVYWVRVRDRFGDNGIVGVAIVRTANSIWELDTFLLSCRVIGRTIETAMLGWISEQARAAGATELHGTFIPTKKNSPAQDVYRQHGFELLRDDEPQGGQWRYDLTAGTIDIPNWIQWTVPERESA